MEQLDLDEVELAEEPFSPIWELLDKLYQYEDLIEVPSRCEEFFQEFMRLKNEDLEAYILRHGTMMKKMKEVHIEIPKLLAGWHLLTRAGVPKWTHVQVKSMCGGDMEYDKVSQALMRMFGGDHRPNSKDLLQSVLEDNLAFVCQNSNLVVLLQLVVDFLFDVLIVHQVENVVLLLVALGLEPIRIHHLQSGVLIVLLHLPLFKRRSPQEKGFHQEQLLQLNSTSGP